MTETLPSDSQHLLSLTLPALLANSPAEFSQGLQVGFSGVCDWLEAQPQERPLRLKVLQHCFSNISPSLRQSRLLQLCSWPVFDKQILPLQAGQMPEFLWMFVLPVTVELALGHPVEVPVRLVLSDAQRQALAHLLRSHHVLNENAQIAVHGAGLTLEDLQKAGPLSLSQEVSRDCAGLSHGVAQLAHPVVLDEQIESGRSFTWYVPCSARLAVGQRQLIQRAASFETAKAQRVFEQAMAEQALQTSTLRAHPPIALAEAMLRCARCGREELALTLAAAKRHYGIQEVCLRLPMEGVAELCAQHPRDSAAEYLLRLPFLVLEPIRALELLLEELCEDLHLNFSGVYSVATQPSSALQ